MILVLIVLFIIAFYFYGTRNFKYWEKRGVPFEKPLILVGSNLKQFIDKVSVSQRFSAFYRAYPNERFVGFFEGNNPAILVRDPELIKHILISDFRHIHYRGLNPHKTAVEPLMKNLFTVDGDIWKLMRQKLTPSFTTSKLKAMFPLIIDRTKKLDKLAEDYSKSGKEVDIRELMAKYTTDFVGACGFGIDSAALENENSDFRKLGKRLFTVTLRDHLVSLLKRSAPETFKNLHFFAPEIETKAFSILRQIMEDRNYKPSGRNDFMDMMLELRQKNKVVGESVDKLNPDGTPQIVELELDDKLLCAQVFVFFAAGFETSSSASSYLLHTLAYHPEVQERCQKEVDEVLKNYDGKLCFDAVHDMKYLAMAFKESMRLLPSPGFLLRKTASKYKIPDSDVTLDEDTMVIISTDALCSDEKYFEEPEKFNPDRFHPDNLHKIKPCTYMPFGDGPRACIGTTVSLSKLLQRSSTDLLKTLDTIFDTLNVLRRKQRKALTFLDFRKLFEGAKEVAQKLRVEIKCPTNVTRQKARLAEEYFRTDVYIPLLDSVINNIKERLYPEVIKIITLGIFVPNVNYTYTNKDIEGVMEISTSYTRLMHKTTLDTNRNELKRLLEKLQRSINKTPSIYTLIENCDAEIFTNVKQHLRTIATLPVSLATAESSVSLGRLKTWLRASNAEDRLTGLALLYVHKNIPIQVDEVITRFERRR